MSCSISELIYNYYMEKDMIKKRKLHSFIINYLNKIYEFETLDITKFFQSEINKFISRQQEVNLFDNNLTLNDFTNKVYDLASRNQLCDLTLGELFLALIFATNISEYHVRRQYKLLNKIQNDNDIFDKVNWLKEKNIDKYQDDLINNIINTIKGILPTSYQSDDNFRKILLIGYTEISDNYKIISDLKNYYSHSKGDLSYYNFLLKTSSTYKK